jgi:hypothetical protein
VFIVSVATAITLSRACGESVVYGVHGTRTVS